MVLRNGMPKACMHAVLAVAKNSTTCTCASRINID